MTDPSGQSYVAAFGLALKGIETIKGMVTTPDAKKQASELFEIILSGQRSALEESVKQRTLLETVRDLEEKLRSLETWDREKQRYALVPAVPGGPAYAIKKSASDGEPPHFICPNCYEERRKRHLVDSIQHPPRKGEGRQRLGLECSACELFLDSGHAGGSITRKYAEDF
jgi:hypothetical protein